MGALIKTFFTMAAFFLSAAAGLYAQQADSSAQTAVITELTGTVEIKHAPSAVWETARGGQILFEDTMVSTGFRSAAIINIGSTVITVRPLTRLTLAEISAASGIETLNINLQAGRVRVDVKPPAGTRASMSVRTPAIVCSVRGTVFEFDTMNLTVNEGTVEFSGAGSVALVLIDAGRFGYVDEQTGRAMPLEEIAFIELRPEMPVTSQEALPMDLIEAENNTVIFGFGARF